MKKYPLGQYGLSIVLATLFVTSWTVQTYAGWKDFVAEQKAHGGTAQWGGDDGYVWHWLSQTMENWQSEFLQLLTFVILTAILIHKGSHESKDEDDRMNEQMNRIEEKIDHIESRLKAGK